RYPVTEALDDNPWLLVALAVTLNLLNVLDLTFTRLGLSMGAIEANPLMHAAFQQGLATAALFKVGVMLLVTAGVWWLRRYRRVLQVAFAATVLYGALALYHVAGLLLIV
ncbi:MAG: DUF5658 family protein, partial [Coriobacteriia bacterium]|nr:DUF5658 family protein [Coriobacteriia bacterium]